MKIQIASDLHIEFERPRVMSGRKQGGLEETDAELIILAGDIGVGYEQESVFCRELAQQHQKPVVFVLGNHSFYKGGNIDVIREQWSRSRIDGVHYLDEGTLFSFKDVLFIGGVFWTNFNDYDRSSMRYAESCMNDYRGSRMSKMDSSGENEAIMFSDLVKDIDNYKPEYHFTARRSVDEHYKTRKWLENKLDTCTESRRVIVTHHAPSYDSIANRFRNGYDSVLNQAFYSDMTKWAKDRGNIDLWVHGHTHSSFDYEMEDGPRVVCNPRGYVGYEPNLKFNPSMVIRI